MSDLIKRNEVLEVLEKVFDEYGMTWDKQGGFAKAVPDAIRNIKRAVVVKTSSTDSD